MSLCSVHISKIWCPIGLDESVIYESFWELINSYGSQLHDIGVIPCSSGIISVTASIPDHIFKRLGCKVPNKYNGCTFW